MSRHWTDVLKEAARDLPLPELVKWPAFVSGLVDGRILELEQAVASAERQLERAKQQLFDSQKVVAKSEEKAQP